MNMNIAQFGHESTDINKLTKKGTEILSTLKSYIGAEFSEHLIVNDTESTPTRLAVTFYGLRLLFRIEMSWGESGLVGSIAANGISDVAPKETPLAAVHYDALGNIDRRMTLDEFAGPFLASVFSKLYSANVILKP